MLGFSWRRGAFGLPHGGLALGDAGVGGAGEDREPGGDGGGREVMGLCSSFFLLESFSQFP